MKHESKPTPGAVALNTDLPILQSRRRRKGPRDGRQFPSAPNWQATGHATSQPDNVNERKPAFSNSNFVKEQSDMARARRKKPYNPAKIHDRRSRDLLRNAEVAAVEVDDPLGLDPGDKIVTLRSIRNDPLARLHTHRQIDEAQYQGGRAGRLGEGGARPASGRSQSRICRWWPAAGADYRTPAQGRVAAEPRRA
jgi:hypothetical protein